MINPDSGGSATLLNVMILSQGHRRTGRAEVKMHDLWARTKPTAPSVTLQPRPG